MKQSLSNLVWKRADSRCEYCQLPQAGVASRFEIDHIISKKHKGQTIASNLALSCFWCNNAKGTDVAGYDPVTKSLCPFFNPRIDDWSNHFRWEGPLLVGRTPIGRITIELLEINDPFKLLLRESLSSEGDWRRL